MYSCDNCKIAFRDKWNLERHMTRIKQCIFVEASMEENKLNKKSTLDNKKSTLDNKKSTLDNKKSTLINPKSTLECKYCINIFSSRQYKNIHEKNCKSRDDPIRLLEIEQNIIPEIPECKTECRYCNKNLSRPSLLNIHYLTCKSKEDYHASLKQNMPISTTTINNTNNNNSHNNSHNNHNNSHNTTNNTTNIVLNFGQDNLDHVEIGRVIELLKVARSEYQIEQVYEIAGELIMLFDNYKNENPQNHNIIIPSSKSLYGEIKTALGWEKISTNRCLNNAFKNSANELSSRQTEIDISNNKVFKNQSNKEIFTEVKQFANKGFAHNTYGTTALRELKSSFRTSKLKNKIVPSNLNEDF